MSTYKILSDTSCDIPAAVLEQLDVTYIPFHVSFDTVQYLKELQDITPDEFYDKINAEKSIPKPLCPPCRITWMPWSLFCLNIKPIIVMRDGELYPESKVRGHKKALKTIMDMTRNEIGSEKELYRVLLVRGEKERHATAEEMRQTLLAEGFDVMDEIWPVGITIGTHTGPTPIGICYIKKYEYVK